MEWSRGCLRGSSYRGCIGGVGWLKGVVAVLEVGVVLEGGNPGGGYDGVGGWLKGVVAAGWRLEVIGRGSMMVGGSKVQSSGEAWEEKGVASIVKIKKREREREIQVVEDGLV